MTQRAWQLQAVYIGDGQEVSGSFADRLLDTQAYALTLTRHIHNRERWLGLITGSQSATDWAGPTLTPFRTISGNNIYGTGTVQVLGTSDTPTIAGNVFFDVNELLIVDSNSQTTSRLRILYGTGTYLNAIANEQYTEAMFHLDTLAGQSPHAPVRILMPRLRCGIDKVWVQHWNVTNGAFVDFFVGIHEYPE